MRREKPTIMASQSPAPVSCEVLVIGAGLAGVAAAIGFSRMGFDVVLCGRPERAANGRTVALLESSVRLLKTLNLWEALAPLAAPLCALRIIDDAGALWRAAPVEFRASEIGLDAFGWNIENADLVDALFAAAEAAPDLRIIESRAVAYELTGARARIDCENGAVVTSDLIVAADGRSSPTRKAAGIDASAFPYPQSALTLIVGHSRQTR